MALDHALAACGRAGEGVLRLYAWAEPTVSFGRNEPARDAWPAGPDGARGAEGLRFVRRPTGGRSVVHAHEVTYAVVIPLRTFESPREAYVRIHRGIVRGLTALGVPAEVAAAGPVLAPDAGPCFDAPAPGEVTAGGRKLVGSAQVRVGRFLLQHGSVLVSGDQSALVRMAGPDPKPDPPTTVGAWLEAEPSLTALGDAVAEGCRAAWGGSWATGGYHAAELAEAERLEAERYATTEWTWRR